MQNILEQIENFKMRTEQIRKDNTNCNEVQWEIHNVSFDEFQEVEHTYECKRSTSDGKLFLNICGYFNNGCGVTVWSVPLKITTTITAEPLLQTA